MGTKSRSRLRLLVVDGKNARPVEVHGTSTETRLGDLAQAVGLSPGGPFTIDGRTHQAAALLDLTGIADGSSVTLASAAGVPRSDGAAVRVETGPEAGAVTVLGPGRYVVSSTGIATTVESPETPSNHHALFLEVGEGSLRAGSVHGNEPTELIDHTRCNVGFADVTLSSSAPGADVMPKPRRFHRPPRTAQVEREAIRLEPLPDAAAPPPPLPVLTMLAPLPVGMVMALLFNPMFALFTLMAPLMMLARWTEGRLRMRRDERRRTEAIAARTRDLEIRLAAATAAEQRRRDNAHPGSDRLIQRTLEHAPDLWQRRPLHDDFATIRVGLGTSPHTPNIEGDSDTLEALADALRRFRTITDVPATIDFASETGLGLVGGGMRCRTLARSLLLQLAAERAPSDLSSHLISDEIETWDWMKWLPHTEAPDGRHRVADDGYTLDTGADTKVVVVDGLDRLYRCDPATRSRLLDDPSVWPIVIAPEIDALPACCSAVVDVEATDSPRCDGITVADAETAARALGRLADPDVAITGAGLPTQVRLCDLPVPAPPADRPNHLRAVLGVDGDGPTSIDLVGDGPHALIAGTTGAGKSELLRTLVASIADSYDQTEVNFVLVDFKGGGAFDVLADLPHTLAVVTDLDEHIAERSLRSLRAELRRREAVLRAAAVSDVADHVGSEPLPRLVVVIDEFATLAAELPDFLASLVDVAQRGRSLGVHLLLATQRPSGVVDAKIRANTNLRIALRVQDHADSVDVIDSGGAADLPHDIAGRAFVRKGSAAAQLIQVACCTLPSRQTETNPLRIEPFHFEPTDHAIEREPRPDDREATTDLDLLTTSLRTRSGSLSTPQPIWQDALPAVLPSHWNPSEDQPWRVPLGIADLPDEQRQEVRFFDAHDGNLALFGSDTTATAAVLGTLAASLCTSHSPETLHLHAFDAGTAAVETLSSFEHTGTIARVGDLELTGRLLRHLASELERRRLVLRDLGVQRLDAQLAGTHNLALTVVLIEGIAALHETWNRDAPEHVAALHSLLRDGPAVGIVTLATAQHDRAIPPRALTSIQRRVVMQLTDAAAHATFGLSPRRVPPLGGHRGYDGEDHAHLTLRGQWSASGTGQPFRERRAGAAPRLQPLDVTVGLEALGPARVARGTLVVPMGLDHDGQDVKMTLRDHALVSGPTGAGKTTTLCTIASQLGRAPSPVRVVVVSTADSPLRRQGDCWIQPDDASSIESLDLDNRTVILVDDADRLSEPAAKAVERLVDLRVADVHVVAAAQPEDLKAFQTWTTCLRRSRTGIVLQPGPGDGDVLRPQQPPKIPSTQPPGRGWLINGGAVATMHVASASHTDGDR